MVAKKPTNEPKNLVIWVIHVSNLSAMRYGLRNAGKRCPGISRRIVSITLRRRQDRGTAGVETAELIQLVAGCSTHCFEPHQRVRSFCRPDELICREARHREQEQHGNSSARMTRMPRFQLVQRRLERFHIWFLPLSLPFKREHIRWLPCSYNNCFLETMTLF